MVDRRRALFSRFVGLTLALAVWLSASLPASVSVAAGPVPADDSCCASQSDANPEPAEKQGDCTRRCVAACCALHAVPAAPVTRVLIETPAIADSPLPATDTGRLVTEALLDPPRPAC